jgi:hypothetical protein
MSYSERIIKTTDSNGNRVRNIINPEKSVNKNAVNKESVKSADSPDMVIITQTPSKVK